MAAYIGDRSVTVQFVANVLAVHSVDTANQVFGLEVVIRARTVGAPSARTKDGDRLTIENWEPRIRLLNTLEISKWTRSEKDAPGGELEFKWTIAGKFTENFELTTFPSDRQDLSIRISSAIPRFCLGSAAPETSEERQEILNRVDQISKLEGELDCVKSSTSSLEDVKKQLAPEMKWLQQQVEQNILTEIVRFEGWPGKTSVVQSDNFCMSGIYHLSSLVRMSCTQTQASSSTTSTIRPLLVMSLSIRRHRGSAFWNVELPMGLITALGLATFATPREAGDRLGVSVTLLLVAVAYKAMISADLPRISYLTMLDKYLMNCFLVLAVVVVENCFCWYEEFSKIDLYFGIFLSIAFLLYLIVHCIVSVWQSSRISVEEQHHQESAKSLGCNS